MPVTTRTSDPGAHAGHCRSCHAPGLERVLDLGSQPVADRLVGPGAPVGAEARYPLALDLCRACALLQLAGFPGEDGVGGHVHGSAVSTTIAEHDAEWADEMVARLALKPGQVALEVDGGGQGVAAALARRGMAVIAPAHVSGRGADLVVANHSLAHASDLDRAVADLVAPLNPGGTVAVEFHHAARLLTETQFDLICHPHRTYLSAAALVQAFARHGLTAVDAAEIPVHGGSVRMYARRGAGPVGASVDRVVAAEQAVGLGDTPSRLRLAEQVETASTRIRGFLQQARAEGRTVLGYGAPSRASTLLNHCGVTADLLPATVDRSTLKQGRALPGCRVPIHAPAFLTEVKPDYVLILAWPLAEEIVEQMSDVRSWGGRFVIPLPDVKVLP
jgi:C-methyltransferase C-terminal domain/Putative zinc binding domain/Methyltransferase domain